jgi:hypothetical protein
MYVFKRRKLLKLLSADAEDAGFTNNSRTSASTVGNMKRMAGTMFRSASAHELKVTLLGWNAGNNRNNN